MRSSRPNTLKGASTAQTETTSRKLLKISTFEILKRRKSDDLDRRLIGTF